MKKFFTILIIILCVLLSSCSFTNVDQNDYSSSSGELVTTSNIVVIDDTNITEFQTTNEDTNITEFQTTNEDTNYTVIQTTNEETDSKRGVFVMQIDDTIVDITWENNNSVKELMECAKNGLTITMSRYGGFEQVGSIGKTITSNNTQITTKPGDVVLYSSNQIVIFFGTNTWSYTKLGHINLSQSELNNLLNKSNVVLKLDVE